MAVVVYHNLYHALVREGARGWAERVEPARPRMYVWSSIRVAFVALRAAVWLSRQCARRWDIARPRMYVNSWRGYRARGHARVEARSVAFGVRRSHSAPVGSDSPRAGADCPAVQLPPIAFRWMKGTGLASRRRALRGEAVLCGELARLE